VIKSKLEGDIHQDRGSVSGCLWWNVPR